MRPSFSFYFRCSLGEQLIDQTRTESESKSRIARFSLLQLATQCYRFASDVVKKLIN